MAKNCLPCPCCGEKDAAIFVNLETRVDFQCLACGADFHKDDIVAFLLRWTKVLDWLDTCPDWD